MGGWKRIILRWDSGRIFINKSHNSLILWLVVILKYGRGVLKSSCFYNLFFGVRNISSLLSNRKFCSIAFHFRGYFKIITTTGANKFKYFEPSWGRSCTPVPLTNFPIYSLVYRSDFLYFFFGSCSGGVLRSGKIKLNVSK